MLKPISIKISAEDLIENRGGTYHCTGLYLAYFQQVPHRISLGKVDAREYRKWFENKFAQDIILNHTLWYRLQKESALAEKDDLFYVLNGELLVYLDTNRGRLQILFQDEQDPRIETLHQAGASFKSKDDEKFYINLIGRSFNDFNLESMEVKRTEGKLEEHYNDDFLPIHQHILKRLNTPQDKGIVLLHGKPGTGKTSYIRHLIGLVKKDVIFLPPAMAGGLAEPGLISILTENPNSIFVIEDAENILTSRDSNRHSPVSTLLNISDGLLADCLNIQIICSFNTDLANIDRALLRKGRLIARYDFKELAVEKSRNLAEKIGHPLPIDRPMALNELYHGHDLDFKLDGKRAIGF